jgi:CHAD domain-containing protein
MLNIYECFYKVIRKQYSALVKYEQGVLKDRDIEDVHQMRVAARRFRAAIRSFKPFIEPEFMLLIRADLRKLARTLGKVRDLDVSILYFSEYLAKNPDNSGVKLLVKDYKKERKKKWKELISFLKKKKYRKLKENLMALAANIKHKSLCDEYDPSYETFYSSFEHVIDEVFKYKSSENLSNSEEELHNLRIAIKHLRYNLEFINLKDSEAKKIIKYLKKMQGKLGIINDCNFMNSQLENILKKKALKVEVKDDIKRLIEYNNFRKMQEKNKINFPWEELSEDALKTIYMPGRQN